MCLKIKNPKAPGATRAPVPVLFSAWIQSSRLVLFGLVLSASLLRSL